MVVLWLSYRHILAHCKILEGRPESPSYSLYMNYLPDHILDISYYPSP